MKGKVGMDFMTTTKEQPLADSMHRRVTRREGGGKGRRGRERRGTGRRIQKSSGETMDGETK